MNWYEKEIACVSTNAEEISHNIFISIATCVKCSSIGLTAHIRWIHLLKFRFYDVFFLFSLFELPNCFFFRTELIKSVRVNSIRENSRPRKNKKS